MGSGIVAVSNRLNALLKLLVSGVASLLSAGDRGVSPADESSIISSLSFRGVLYKLLKAGRGGKGL